MNIVLGVIIGLVVLMALVVAHEFGHFIAARRNGVWVEEFGIGFPPRAKAWLKNPEYTKWQKEKKAAKKAGKKFDKKRPKKWLPLPKDQWGKPQKDLIFSINFLPIGGFCSMKGESDNDKRPASFGQATFWQKTKILFAGVAMNWLVAFILLTILSLTGMPHFVENQFQIDSDTHVTNGQVVVAKVLDDTPAAKAGLKENDQIKSITADDKTTEIGDTSTLISINEENRGKEVKYQIVRDGKDETIDVKLGDKDATYALGISMAQKDQALYRSTWSAPIVGAATTVQLTAETYKGLGTAVYNLFSGIFKQFSGDEAVREEGKTAIGAAGDSVSGPVGILGVLFPAFVDTGLSNLLFLAALISISLACMNVLPIPALDGGRWLLIAIYRLRKKELTKETEEKIVSRAFMVLLVLIALITVLDIIRLF
ncbi:site-2 protease family protein [Candidatus Saccharibacteria bacterium]|nr:site-2 protease family protein [Candidatus Saccharibacteria bacterium]